MKRIHAGILCLVLLCAACGGGNGGGGGATSTPETTHARPGRSGTESPQVTSPAMTPDGTPMPGSTTLQVWFAFMPGGGGATGPFLFESYREVPATSTPGTAAVNALLAGPTTDEKRAGLSTTVPSGTKLLGLSVAGGIGTVDLSGRFASGGGTTSETMRLAQLVYTLTQFPTVKRVLLKLDGKPVGVFSSEGIVLNGPQTRKDFEDLLPPILVGTPGIGESITSPVMVAGTANVFEGTVSIRILDAKGKVIASATTTATCGTGCRGDFRKRVAFQTSTTQDGTVEVFEASAENGKPINIVSLPVTLSP